MPTDCFVRRLFLYYADNDGSQDDELIDYTNYGELFSVDHRQNGVPLGGIMRLYINQDKNKDNKLSFEEFSALFTNYELAQGIANLVAPIGIKRLYSEKTNGIPVTYKFKDETLQFADEKTFLIKGLGFRESEVKTVESIFNIRTTNPIINKIRTMMNSNPEQFYKCLDMANLYRDCRHSKHRFFAPSSPDQNLNYGELCDFIFYLISI